MKFFRFKQFQITDDRSAMKVGTDSVILGSWVQLKGIESVLDIGCGSGLISLMLAQRNHKVKVIGVDIESAAIEDASYNFENTQWVKRLTAIHSDIRSFQTNQKFDLVISNPPFFSESLLPSENVRAGARHDENLNVDELLNIALSHLSNEGVFALVFPFERELELLTKANDIGLYPKRIMNSKNKPKAQRKRSFIEFTRLQSSTPIIELLEIRDEGASYSQAYRKLTEDFYLNF